jgi:polyisoprenoid-binding protein YceI
MKHCTIDPDHSVATFAIRHLMIANVHGMFPKVTGTIRYDDQDITRSSVEAEIDVASLSTGVKKRDEHVLSAEMLDAGRFPKMAFRSTRVERKADRSLNVHGDLTIHGVTRAVVLEVAYFGPVKSPFGGEITLGFSASTKVNREDFGIFWGSEALEGGGFLAGKEVEITIDLEADLEGDV